MNSTTEQFITLTPIIDPTTPATTPNPPPLTSTSIITQAEPEAPPPKPIVLQVKDSVSSDCVFLDCVIGRHEIRKSIKRSTAPNSPLLSTLKRAERYLPKSHLKITGSVAKRSLSIKITDVGVNKICYVDSKKLSDSTDQGELLSGSVIKFYHAGIFSIPISFRFDIDHVGLLKKYGVESTQITSLSVLSLPNFEGNYMEDDDTSLNNVMKKIWVDEGIEVKEKLFIRDVKCVESIQASSNYGKRLRGMIVNNLVDTRGRLFEGTRVVIKK
ncbi:hypothetical protein TrST_g5747 [Triparma strigata]|uniref:Uncharacterized protein n=1 Tax=Triparma strigata TaxID=1606541 RepID=A0A9W6ZMP2_9STRA|nr:hypothetical protein TrST_g5747 [Triparma strigata]